MSIIGYVIFVILALLIVSVPFQYKKVGPNEVLIITGSLRRRAIKLPDGTEKKVGYRIKIGGGAYVWPFIESYLSLPLQNIPMDFEINDVIAQNGIKGKITGTAQVKINGSEPEVHLAAEQFLGKNVEDVKENALKTIEGHARAIIGTVNLEFLNKSRKEFSEKIFAEVEPEFNRMGLKLIAFSLRDIGDPTGYLEALGRSVIANAKRDAEVAEAEANRDAVIKSSSALKEGDVAKLKAELEVAEAAKNIELQKSEFQAILNEKRAISDYTYDLERQKMNKLLKEEEFKVDMLDKENSISLSQKEKERVENDLEASVRLPASAEKFRLVQEAEAMAEAKKIQGDVEAELTREQGKAEAFVMKDKADAFKEYNSAALITQLIEIMPELAREVSEPLSKIEKIVMVNNGSETSGMSKITGDVAEVIAQIPTVIESLSGIELKKLLSRLPALKDATENNDSVENQDNK